MGGDRSAGVGWGAGRAGSHWGCARRTSPSARRRRSPAPCTASQRPPARATLSSRARPPPSTRCPRRCGSDWRACTACTTERRPHGRLRIGPGRGISTRVRARIGAVLWQLLTRDCVGCSGEAASRAPSLGARGRWAPMPVPRAAPHDARGRAGAGRGAAAHRRAECVGDVASVRLRASLAARRCDKRLSFSAPPAGA